MFTIGKFAAIVKVAGCDDCSWHDSRELVDPISRAPDKVWFLLQ